MMLEFIFWVAIIIFTLTTLIVGSLTFYNTNRDPLIQPFRKGHPMLGAFWFLSFACIISYWIVS